MKIYHNPRCSKSRKGLQHMEDKGYTFEVVKYLEEGISETELSGIIAKSGKTPFDFVRQHEKDYKEFVAILEKEIQSEPYKVGQTRPILLIDKLGKHRIFRSLDKLNKQIREGSIDVSGHKLVYISLKLYKKLVETK